MPAASMVIKASQVATPDTSAISYATGRSAPPRTPITYCAPEGTGALRYQDHQGGDDEPRHLVQQAAAHDRQREAERLELEARPAGYENRSRSPRSSRSRAANSRRS